MTGHERFMSALRREQPDRVPVWELIVNDPTLSAWGATDLESFVEAEDLDGVTIFEDLALRSPNADERIRAGLPADEGEDKLVVDEWGIIWDYTDVAIPYPVSGPILTAADLKGYVPPDPDAPHRLVSLQSALERFEGQRAVVFLTHDGFEFPHYLRGGMDHLFFDYVDNPGLAHDLSEITLEYKIRLMKRAIEAGADAVVSGDDYAGREAPLMSPGHFRDFVLPYLKRSVQAAHEMGVPYIKHTDGNIWPIFDMLIEAGIDAIDPLEPIAGMDIGQVKTQYGDRVALIGNVDCTELLTNATEAQVEEAVKETISKAAPGGGYILASSNSIHPAVKPANYRAMADTAREWGTYPLDSAMIEEYRQQDYAGEILKRGSDASRR